MMTSRVAAQLNTKPKTNQMTGSEHQVFPIVAETTKNENFRPECKIYAKEEHRTKGNLFGNKKNGKEKRRDSLKLTRKRRAEEMKFE